MFATRICARIPETGMCTEKSIGWSFKNDLLSKKKFLSLDVSLGCDYMKRSWRLEPMLDTEATLLMKALKCKPSTQHHSVISIVYW